MTNDLDTAIMQVQARICQEQFPMLFGILRYMIQHNEPKTKILTAIRKRTGSTTNLTYLMCDYTVDYLLETTAAPSDNSK